MKPETKYLDKTEACYETEYALRKDIHYRKGEIEKLEYLNAKHCREIERLRFTFDEMDKSVGECLSRINELEFELNIRNVPAMKESLKAGARLAIKQDDEITTLKAELCSIKSDRDIMFQNLRNTVAKLREDIRGLEVELSEKQEIIDKITLLRVNEVEALYNLKAELSALKDDSAVLMKVVRIVELWDTLPTNVDIRKVRALLEDYTDIPYNVGDQIDRITELKNLFEYLKALLIELSSEDGIASINPDDIDVKYIEAACRYCYPVLFDKFAVLSEDSHRKIEMADSILEEFGIEKMDVYQDLIANGDIDIKYVDMRPKGL